MDEYFECPECGSISYNKRDIQEGYCARCHDWTGERVPAPEYLKTERREEETEG